MGVVNEEMVIKWVVEFKEMYLNIIVVLIKVGVDYN